MTTSTGFHADQAAKGEQPCPMISLGLDFDQDKATQRREALQDRWEQYAEKLSKLHDGHSVAEDAHMGRVAYEKSGLNSRPEDARSILGLAKPDSDVAMAMQAALMHVYAKSSADHIAEARDALSVFVNMHPFFSELRITTASKDDIGYPDFRIRRIIQMDIEGCDSNSRIYDDNRKAAAHFWSEIMEDAAAKWDFEPSVSFAREHARMLADVGADSPDAAITKLLRVKHLEPTTAKAIHSVLFALYNSNRTNELSLGSVVASLLIFIQNHPKLHEDNVFGSTIARRQNYIVAELPQA